jgi:hypothetical protein
MEHRGDGAVPSPRGWLLLAAAIDGGASQHRLDVLTQIDQVGAGG